MDTASTVQPTTAQGFSSVSGVAHSSVYACARTFKGGLSSNLFTCSKAKQLDKNTISHYILFFNYIVSQEASNEVRAYLL